MAINRSLVAVCLGVATATSGCVNGFLYTNIREPLSMNMERTPANGKVSTAHNQGVRIPLGRATVGAQWKSDVVGEAAKEAGMTRVYYADIQRISILGGIWQDATVYVVGE